MATRVRVAHDVVVVNVIATKSSSLFASSRSGWKVAGRESSSWPKVDSSSGSYVILDEQSYEVIGNPPAISVPTHFAKVVLAARGSPGGFSSGSLPVSGPMGKDVAIGAFVLPNSVIPDHTPLTDFSVPGELARFRETGAMLIINVALIFSSRSGRTGRRIDPLFASDQVDRQRALPGDPLSSHRQAVRRCRQKAAGQRRSAEDR